MFVLKIPHVKAILVYSKWIHGWVPNKEISEDIQPQ
jgi:hypothetical protein